MKIKGMFLALAFSVLALAGMAAANTGLQTTSYSTNNFSATFNGPVTANAPKRNAANTSTDYSYYSFDAVTQVGQIIIVRFIDHDIAVSTESSEFYANDDTTPGPITNRSTDTYQGHPLSYTRRKDTEYDTPISLRTRYIIVNSREVIFVKQLAPFVDYTTLPNGGVGLGDQPQWFDFEDSLVIR